MKTKILLSLVLTLNFCLLQSQVPQGFNYQAIARDPSDGNNPITGASMQVKIGILSDTIANTMVWEELFNPVKTNAFGMFTIVVGTGVKQSGSAATFSAIDWTKTPLFLRTSIYFPSSWKTMGTTKLQSVPYSMVAGNLEGAVPLLSVKGNTTTMDSALFVVRNNTGQIVFAVYNEGVRIYVDDGVAKGATKGGFAIGSFDKSKGTTQPYFIVAPDSIRAYIDNNPVKAVKGGFAIGGFDRTKGSGADFLNVSPNSTDIINPSQNRILWYPAKNAFLTGRVLIEKPDSVGENSFASGFESRAEGPYSQALGYQAVARGYFSTSIGYQSEANKDNSFAFGQWAQAKNQESYAFGRGAIAEGFRSFAFGSAGVDSAGVKTGVAYAKGDYSFAIGQGSQSLGLGTVSIGTECVASSGFSTALGYKTRASSWFASALGDSTVASGTCSVSMGYKTAATDFATIAIGDSTLASGAMSFSGGSFCKSGGDMSFSFGYYSKTSGGLSFAFGDSTEASEFCSFATGYRSKALGAMSIAGGSDCQSTGDRSLAFGYFSKSNGYNSIAIGTNNIADSANSVALGFYTKANGFSSLAAGFKSTASGFASVAIGKETNANSFASVVIGQYNGTLTAHSEEWWPTEPVFVIGNGTDPLNLSNAMTVLKNGCVGIQSIINPTYALQLPNSSNVSAGSGRAYAWTTYSDSRLKEDQIPLSYGIKELMKLSPMQYIHHSSIDKSVWSKDNAPKSIGLIAQEVIKVIPEAVDVPKNEATELWGLNYDKLIPVLIKSIQEQQKQIESYKSEIQTLQEKIELIESQQKELNELKTLVNTLIVNQNGQGNR